MRKVSTLLLLAGCLALGVAAAEDGTTVTVTSAGQESNPDVVAESEAAATSEPASTSGLSVTSTSETTPAPAVTTTTTTTPAVTKPALVAVSKAKNIPVSGFLHF